MSKIFIVNKCSDCPFCVGADDKYPSLKGYCRQTYSIVTGAELTDNCPLLNDGEDDDAAAGD